MFKLMHKKLNKKGFTLAELLVVVAIIAILVAIAIPVFTRSLEEAQIRTNAANIRSTRSAAVEHILANWNKQEDSTVTGSPFYREGAIEHSSTVPGWYAIGTVDTAGNLTDVKVHVNWKSSSSSTEVPVDLPDGILKNSNVPATEDDITLVEASGNTSPAYYTFVYIKDTDIN